MFSNNQVLKISGDKKEQLSNIIDFILSFEHEKSDLSHVNGLKETDGKLVFGWIPRDNNNKFETKYAEEYDTVFDNPVYFNKTILIEIIFNWLEEQKDTYEKLWEENKVGYWDTPTNGFLVTGLSDETERISNQPTFATFMIEPFWTEYTD